MDQTPVAEVPLTVRLEVLDPEVDEGTDTLVEPAQPIHFRCIVDGRPRPSVFYSWLPVNTTQESGDVGFNASYAGRNERTQCSQVRKMV